MHKLLCIDSPKGFPASNDASWTYTSRRKPLPFKEATLMVKVRMKPANYDIQFNNCQRFVRTLVRRIPVREEKSIIGIWVTILRVYRMFPVSFFATAYEYSKGSIEDLLPQNGKAQLSQAAFFLLTAGRLFGFLIMVREPKGWDVVEERWNYIWLLQTLGIENPELREVYLRGAFDGPSGMRNFVHFFSRERMFLRTA
ncbi:hypothetical protein AYL99_04105 [Fonsecaea erecta]|uniref:Uncharacterized protein n=1 Tax=Fonsecaea erecta TaxID=1367422 RepID=A0A178ZQI0_9EURO|nr:hypothetical protein AYL99_04105 [Fonsecaea erecta]OAP61902.1 hypothetical protein AYL99_04105 [Fonsecaea erecta]